MMKINSSIFNSLLSYDNTLIILCQYLYDRAIRYMMQGRITNLTEKEATIMTKYLSKSYMHEKGLDDRITVNVLDWENFIKRHKSDKLNGMCTTLSGRTIFHLTNTAFLDFNVNTYYLKSLICNFPVTFL